MLQSALYTGQVFHKRYGPKEHILNYRSFFILLDLDELPALQNISSLFAWNRRGWFSVHETDFGPRPSRINDDRPNLLKRELEALLVTHGFPDSEWHFQLLTMPRTLGYAFNPISLVYCHDIDNKLSAMIYEVSNTFGERIHYVLPVENSEAPIRQHCKKKLFVSPFFDMDGDYFFEVDTPKNKLNFKIDYIVEDELKLRASFTGVRQDFTSKNLRSLALKQSNATYKVILGIHWEAIKLWWKGLPVVNHVPLIVQAEELATPRQPDDTLTADKHQNNYEPQICGVQDSNTPPPSNKNELDGK